MEEQEGMDGGPDPIQTVTRQVDIPDKNAEEQAKVVLPKPVELERLVRRFIRPDGLYRRDIESTVIPASTIKQMVDLLGLTEEDGAYLRQAKTEQVIAMFLGLNAREITRDKLTDRTKSVPGWNMGIAVPGFESSQKYAPKKPSGEKRQEINEALLVKQNDEIAGLTNLVKELTAKIAGDAPDRVDPKSIDDMTQKELNAFIDNQELVVDKDLNKVQKVAAIREAIEAR